MSTQLVSAEELSLVEANSLNAKQLQQLLKKTPPQYIKKRPAKGGGEWEYVPVGYVTKVLNIMFGWDWDFEILTEQITSGECVVKGRLTCRTNGHTIVKTQFGNKEIMYRKQREGEERQPLSIGNDLKAAASDALKKCAAQIGIAADIYNKDDFREVNVDISEVNIEDIRELLDLKKASLSERELKDAQRIVNNNETDSFKKLYKKLQAL